jgi:hypothetical protein
MPVSRRLRYEILRRDNHACRYCGAIAPDVKLTVDHVVPTALGGDDEPENLVTACADCNAGKSSTNPEAPLVADVKQDALRWSRAMEEAAELQRLKRIELDRFLMLFRVRWDSVYLDEDYWIDTSRTWNYKSDPDRKYPVAVCDVSDDESAHVLVDSEAEAWDWIKRRVQFPELPKGWRESAEIWFSAGITIEDVDPLMRSVADKQKVHRDSKWRYFCGCVWTLIRERQQIASALAAKQEVEEP